MKIEITRPDNQNVQTIQIFSGLTTVGGAGSIDIQRTGIMTGLSSLDISQQSLVGITQLIEITTKPSILISNRPVIEIRHVGIEPRIIQITARGLPGPSGGGGSGNGYFPQGWS